jgi:hypothetical protein
MSGFSRRQFLAGAGAAGAAMLVGRFGPAQEVAGSGRKASDVVTLGRSGVKTSILGIGTGTRGGREQRELGTEGFTRLVRHALDNGIRYIDTADTYRMHVFVQIALQGVSSDKYFIQTKTRAQNAEVARNDIERFRRELGVASLDTLLVHCMQKAGWDNDMRPVMDVLYEAKEKEQVRAVGVSCHGLDPLLTSTDCDWVDVHLVRINPFGAKMDGEPDQVAAEIQKMHDRGHGVLGMKIFGEDGFDSPEKRFQSLKYVLGLGCVDAFTIGFTSTDQIDETMDMIARATA